MSIVQLCPYDINGEHCKYEIYYGEPIFSKCKNCSRTIFKRVVEMKDEEMAVEYAEKQNLQNVNPSGIVRCKIADGFLAGLKAGRPKWHDLEKEPTDLPKDNHNVWCKALDHYGEGWYDKDTNTWTLIYRGYHLHCIEAWCEIPTFDKE